MRQHARIAISRTAQRADAANNSIAEYNLEMTSAEKAF